MTRDEILNMEAGQKLDTLILEHVFGARWYNRNGRNFLLMAQDVEGWDGKPGKVESKKPDYIGGFNWSVDIAKAWEVVKEMAKRGHCFNLSYDLIAWTASFGSGRVNTTKSNAAEEICRAALLATLESVK